MLEKSVFILGVLYSMSKKGHHSMVSMVNVGGLEWDIMF